MGPSEQILYLDYDGVLHPEDVRVHSRRGIFVHSPAGHTLFEHAALLEALLAPFPQVQIVLSTTWVRVRGFTHARDRLPPALRRRVIGATFHSQHMREWEFVAKPRGQQILEDVARRRPSRWLAIDDDHADWPRAYASHLVRSHDVLGLSDPATREALERGLWLQFLGPT